MRLKVLSLALCSLLTSVAAADEGWYANIDMLFIAPKISDQGVTNIFYYGGIPSITRQGGSIESPLEFAQRVNLGYEGECGGGLRVRWFTFDNNVDYVGEVEEGGPPISLAGQINLDVDAIDSELTQRGNFQNWDWRVSGGARYARVSLREEDINFEDLSDIVWFGSTGVEFEGAGPTFSAEGNRPILFDGLSIFARARTALLFGETDVWSAFEGGGRYRVHNEFVQVWEFQLGLESEREYEWFDLVSGIFWEAQRWDSDSGFLGDLAFHGFGARLGIEY